MIQKKSLLQWESLEKNFTAYDHQIENFNSAFNELFRQGLIYSVDNSHHERSEYVITDKGKKRFEYERKNREEKVHTLPLLDDSPKTQGVITTPSKKDKIMGKTWYDKPLFTYIIWPLLVGLIILALTLYFT